MNKFVTLMTSNGPVELPFYVDNRELAEDVERGLVRKGDTVIYMRIVGEVIGNFEDCDGMTFTEIMWISGWGPSMVVGTRETGRSEAFTLNTADSVVFGFKPSMTYGFGGFNSADFRDFVSHTTANGWTVHFS